MLTKAEVLMDEVSTLVSDNCAPIFVVGTQRSGTTLLCRMLSAHHNLFVMNEMDGIDKKISLDKTPKEVLDSMNAQFLRKYGMNIEAFLAKNGKTRWGLKDPALTYCLNNLKNYFPESKIIFIIRDGRAVANSYLKIGWGVANIYGAGERWKNEIELQQRYWEGHPENSYTLRYEDLLADPAKELAKLCVFIGETFDESMVTYYQEPGYIKERSYNTNVFRPIDRSIEVKWKTELSPNQICVFESVAGQKLQEFGYPLVSDGKKIPPILKLWWRWHQKIMGELQLQYHWRVKPMIQKLGQ